MRGKAAPSGLDGLELAVELPVDNLLALDEALGLLASYRPTPTEKWIDRATS